MATAKLFTNGSSQAVRLPKAFRLPGKEVLIRKEGNAVILEPLPRPAWPKNYFRKIRISDPSFRRPPQDLLPAVPAWD